MTPVEDPPYDWDSEYETWRHNGADSKDLSDRRSDFERDRDRIVHSIAFRRLQGKTQIFASTLAGPMRTRLTHTLEVAQIGEAIGRRLGLPEHLTGATCLAHDVGHPPFGHFGETVLSELMLPYGGFDANAQTLRTVVTLEVKNNRYMGLNLTRATLLGLLKYPYEREAQPTVASASSKHLYSQHPETGALRARKRFVYDDDYDLVRTLLKGSGLDLLGATNRDAPPPRSIVCQIADWADDIAYSLHDLEDGITARYLDPDHFTDLSFVRTVHASANADREAGSPEISEGHVVTVLTNLRTALNTLGAVEHVGGLRQVTRKYINDYLLSTTLRRADTSARAFGFELRPDPEHRRDAEIFKAMTREYVIKDARTTRYMFKGRRMLEQLFAALTDDPKIVDATSDQLLPRTERQRLLDAPDDDTLRARVVCDYLVNLTEGQLVALYRTMFESGGGPALFDA